MSIGFKTLAFDIDRSSRARSHPLEAFLIFLLYLVPKYGSQAAARQEAVPSPWYGPAAYHLALASSTRPFIFIELFDWRVGLVPFRV